MAFKSQYNREASAQVTLQEEVTDIRRQIKTIRESIQCTIQTKASYLEYVNEQNFKRFMNDEPLYTSPHMTNMLKMVDDNLIRLRRQLNQFINKKIHQENKLAQSFAINNYYELLPIEPNNYDEDFSCHYEDVQDTSVFKCKSRKFNNKDEFVMYEWLGSPELKKAPRDPALLDRCKLIIQIYEMLRSKIPIRVKFFYEEKLDTRLLNASIWIIYNSLPYFNDYATPLPDCDYNEPIDEAEEAYTYNDYNLIAVDKDILSAAVHLFTQHYTPTLDTIAKAQMERPDEVNSISQIKASNVVLTATGEETIAEPIKITTGVWDKLTTSSLSQNYDDLMNRWHRFYDFKWSKDDSYAKNLITYLGGDSMPLPLSFVSSFENSPNCILFKNYAYWRGDMEIRIEVNSNVFQVGALQASFYYGADSDTYYKDRDNLACASQMAHCIINAGSSNDGILKIPFRYYKPWVPTRLRDDDNLVLNVGRLRIKVLNVLRVADSAPSSCHVSLFIRFPSSKFSGMLARNLGRREMFSGRDLADIAQTSANLLNQVFPDPQRDNPPDVFPPKTLVPQSASSWCIGDGLTEPINPLRLNASGQTPHPPGTLPSEPEMTIDYVKKIYGLVTKIEWSTSTSSEKPLLILPASPILRYDQYYNVSVANPKENPLSCAVMPPVSVLAELFAYWRGSLDFRFDFVATQFHTGRLILAYIPRIPYNDIINCSTSQLLDCDHVIIDIHDTKQYSFIQPFISDKPFWLRRLASAQSAESNPPGHLVLGILNSLTVTTNIASKIDINIYLRGGDDFTLAVPTQPNIALSFNTDIIVPPATSITYLPAYGPPANTIGFGSWRYILDGTVGILRYGSGSDHITQFNGNIKYQQVYVFADETIKITHPDYTTLKYLTRVPDPQNLHDQYYYATLFDTYENATAFAKTYNGNALDIDTKINWSLLLRIKEDGPYLTFNKTIFWKFYTAGLSDLEYSDSEIDQRRDDDGEELCVHSVNDNFNASNLLFGEVFDDLRQLTRRYQFYGAFQTTQAVSSLALADCLIPLLPQGLDLMLRDSQQKEMLFGNKCRDGVIPIICSGYRFFRGGLRFRFIVSSDKDCYIWIQHRPDMDIGQSSIFKVDDKKTLNYVEDMINHGYATIFQGTSVNGIVSVEIPYYLPGQFGLLQRPNYELKQDAVHYGLGSLAVSVDKVVKGSAGTTNQITSIFYSHADDMTLSVFQGFPPVYALDMFHTPPKPPKASAEMFKFVKNKLISSIASDIQNTAINTANELNSGAEPLMDVSSIASSLFENQAIKDYFRSTLSGLNIDSTSLLRVLSQFVHICLNPSISTLCWAILNALCELGLCVYAWVVKVYDVFAAYFKHFINKLSSDFSAGSQMAPLKTDIGARAEGDVHSSQDEDKISAAFMSSCVTGLLVALKISPSQCPKNIPDFSSMLWKEIPKFTYTSNCLHRFFLNNLKFFGSIYNWLLRKFKPEYALARELASADSNLRDFLVKCLWCLDEEHKMSVTRDPEANLQLYECANRAQVLLCELCTNSKEYKDVSTLRDMCNKIIKLRNEVSRVTAAPAVRFEPFVISVVGTSNIGKSHVTNSVIKNCLSNINYRSFEQPIYVRTCGNAYWNGLTDQAAVVYDDFLAIDSGEPALLQISELFLLKSKAIFNPPMAAVEDKQRRFNPLLVYINSNKSHQAVNGIGMAEAWYRRRDILWHVRPSKLLIDECPSAYDKKRDVLDMTKVKPYLLKDYKHLEFVRYPNPCLNVVDNDIVYTYKEFLELNIAKFKEYFMKESGHYNATIQELKQLYPEDPSEYRSILSTNPFQYEAASVKLSNARESDQSALAYFKQIYNNLKRSKLSFLPKLDKFKTQQELDHIKELDEIVDLVFKNKDKPEYKAQLDLVDNYLTDNPDDKIYVEGKVQLLQEAKEMTIPEKTKLLKNILSFNLHKPSTSSAVLSPSQGATVSIEVDSIADANIDFHCSCCVSLNNLGYTADGKTIVCFDRFNEKYVKLDNLECDVDEDEKCCLYKNGSCVPRLYGDLLPYEADFSPEFTNGPFKELTANFTKQHNESVRVIASVDVDDYLNVCAAQKSYLERIYKNLPSWSAIGMFFLKFSFVASCISLAFSTISSIVKNLSSVKSSIFTAKINNEVMNSIASSSNKAAVISDMSQKFLPQLGEMPSSGSSMTAGAKIMSKVIQPNTARKNCSPDVANTLVKRLIRNTFWIVATYKDEKGVPRSVSAKCLGICAHNFIALDHYYYTFNNLPASTVFSFVSERVNLPLKYAEIKHLNLNNSAIIVSKLPPSFVHFKDIRKFVIKSKDTANLGKNMFIYDYHYDYVNEQFLFKEYNMEFSVHDSLIVDNDDDVMGNTYVERLLRYKRHYAGMCGSVIVAGWNTPTPILGIHIAGNSNSGFGYAEAICSETFDNVLLSSFDVDDTFINKLAPPDTASLQINTQVTPIGTVPKSLKANLPRSSRLVHTTCADKINPITYDFPLLDPRDPRISSDSFSPLLQGCLNHGDVPSEFPSFILEAAYSDLKAVILANVKPLRQSVGKLTVEQSIIGIPEVAGYDRLDFDTSEGFPLIHSRPKGATNKRWLFDLLETNTGYELKGISSKLQEILDSKESQRNSGIIPFTLFMNCLKDAKLPKEKACLRGKTRIFAISPVDYTIQSRQYFMDFSTAYQSARLNAEHAIGIDINSIEATDLVNHLIGNRSTKLVTGDYSKFGDTLMPSCVYYAYRIMIEWYQLYGSSLEDSKVRWILAYEVIHSYHLMNDLVYQTHCGMPSGNPLTVIINSLVNSLYVRCVWSIIMIRQAPNFISLDSFRSNCRLITYGDDLIMSVSDSVSEVFNSVTMSAVFAEYNIKFTDAIKSGNMQPYCLITDPEASFLKRTFHPHPNRKRMYLAKLDDRAMREICNWTWNTNRDITQCSIEACKAMLENCYGHGPEIYNELLSRICNFWISEGQVFSYLSWEMLDARIFNDLVNKLDYAKIDLDQY